MTFPAPLRAGTLALLLLGGGAAAPAQTPETLRKGDALLIRIDRVGGGIPEYREIVDSDGQIEMPFLGFLAAESQTIAAVETLGNEHLPRVDERSTSRHLRAGDVPDQPLARPNVVQRKVVLALL